ncbi:TPA: hypothetical protein ACOQ31_005689 [Bacillus cereus]|uniref:hypothetical protein n=1 Tax=Bacillus cereus group TaxID=86661 RepID=UPI000241E749|nr:MULTISPECIES: hypothetical protein [Bacillus cereus group]AEW58651.1 hypothetical protein bcf_27810 [Bacillus cereus F837/76]AJH66268.1 hypothetical protein BF32_5454 [Bacillus thuringiensis]MCC2347148.1 hypothetical protein [Bacillus anthracis]PEU80153.1 hypothetical protein CN394_14360 [Bacillus anthracis]QKH33394.1 hypothetical protein FOC87_27395 [Bacillus thuringiensis]
MEKKSQSFVVTVTPIEESSSLTIQSDQTNMKKEIQTPEKPDQRLVPSKTAKISPAVLLKLNTLKPFIQEQEGMDKTSINNIIDMLVEHYVDANLKDRHSKAYKDMYKRLYEVLENK